jgi:RNA polymerase sigma-70 factor (ECF subfamily)
VEALSSVFLARWPGSSGFRVADMGARLDSILGDAVARGRSAWPALDIDHEAFVAHVAARLPADDDPAAALEALHVGDLYLAFACSSGADAALAAFDAAHLRELPAVARVDSSAAFVDEVRQRLRVHLFVDKKIAEYSGRGPLAAWVRVVSLRLGHMLRRSGKREVNDDDAANELVFGTGGDPELEIIKQRYRGEFVQAVREAVRGLDKRSRTLLRLNQVDRLNIDKIGVLYGVHRATVATWIADARKQILTATRAALQERLKLTRAEFESLMGLVVSNLEVSLNRLLGDTHHPENGNDSGS